MNARETHLSSRTDAQSGGLAQYQQLRLELAAIIRSVKQLCREINDGTREQQARRLLSNLADDRFNLAVVGQFKRGKSSLMNAILGLDRLPTGVLPLTSVITTVRYGDRECVLIQRRGAALATEIPLAQLEEYVTEKGNPGNRKHVVLAEVLLPVEVLRLGFHFIDTPGIASGIAANTATTQRFLPEADAIIFVTSFESPLNESELAFLKTVAKHVHKMFFVVNKLDMISVEEREAVLDFVRKRLAAQIGVAEPPLFAVSARDGLTAKLAGNRELLFRSGLPELELALTQFLTSEKRRQSLLRTVERTIVLLNRERLEQRIADLRRGLKNEAAEALKREWECGIDPIKAECHQITEDLRSVIRSSLPSNLKTAIDEHCTDLNDDLVRRIDALLALPDPSTTAQELRELTERADNIADEHLRRWLSRDQPKILEGLWDTAAQHVDRLEQLQNEALNLAVRLFRLPAPATSWRFSKEDDPFSWGTVTPLGWHPRFAWELDLLATGWVRRRIRRVYLQTLEVAKSTYWNRVAEALSDAGAAWVDALDSEVQEHLSMLKTQIENAMRGDSASAMSAKAPALISSLEVMKSKLASTSALADAAPAILSNRAAIRTCFLCEQIQADLFDFFVRRQYALATDDVEQRAHAAWGGFCPLHTWQYERIASPQGVCAAYAPLLVAMARQLRGIATSSMSSRSMRDRVLELSPSARTCPACQRAAKAENEAIREWKQAANGDSDLAETGLCMVHLGAVLDRETDPEVARRVIVEQASVLNRISEDMQTYSMKYDAVRRELASDQEWMAHVLGLSRLVGSRGLSVA